jgi:CDP-diacylglycerol--glycerol-3-phosphate 3-phosphatidyltransferase
VINILGRARISEAIAPLGRRLARTGVSPDAITVVGTVGAVAGALIFFPRGDWFVGTLIVWGFVMLDLLDGAVARAGGRSSKFGAVLDSTCDRVADAAVFASIGWYFARHDQPWMLALCLLCLVLGSLTSYIKARAEGMGMTCNVGIAERSERLIIVLVGTGLTGAPFHVPFVQAAALWVLLAASAITVIQRLSTVWRQSRSIAESPSLEAAPRA